MNKPSSTTNDAPAISKAPLRLIRAAIVDDEGPSRRILRQLLTEFCEGVAVVGEADSLQSGVTLLNMARPDVVFLDVDLGLGTGFDILERLDDDRELQVVFVTAYADYATRAFRVAATDYLVKPIEIGALEESLDRVRARMPAASEEGAHIEIPHGNGYRFLSQASISSLQADGSYTYIRLLDGEKVLVSRKLGQMAELLEASRFYRIHRSHIVNLDQVVSRALGTVRMAGGEEVPISRSLRPEIRELLQKRSQ